MSESSLTSMDLQHQSWCHKEEESTSMVNANVNTEVKVITSDDTHWILTVGLSTVTRGKSYCTHADRCNNSNRVDKTSPAFWHAASSSRSKSLLELWRPDQTEDSVTEGQAKNCNKCENAPKPWWPIHRKGLTQKQVAGEDESQQLTHLIL